MWYLPLCIAIVVSMMIHGVKESGERERILDEKIRRGIK